mmetsp:Transcript_8719/g.12333  ORF Transcript_8719/g.12333 Transcript_8719/m.12333 type:complete len:616 (+) Transcript_8719:2-1849(+)
MKLVITSVLLISSVSAFVGPSFASKRNVLLDQKAETGKFSVSGSGERNKVNRHHNTRLLKAIRSQTPALRATSDDATDDKEYDEICEVLVLGGGPAGRAMASLLSSSKAGLDVVVADSNFDSEWAPNYGFWTDEWEAIVAKYQSFGVDLKGGNCGQSIDREWKLTDCYFGGSFNIPVKDRKRLDRPYMRVDKNALQSSLTSSGSYRVVKSNHISTATSANLYSPTGSLVHDDSGTTITLQDKEGKSTIVRAKLVVDCTGHETKLVLRDTRSVPNDPPGFQIAYGALVEVDETNSPDKTHIGPYYKEAMTLFDYRTDHFDNDEAWLRKANSAPTFMYAMPLKDNKIFFEETSLVARPAISFQECKDRCFRRLEHLGIKVVNIEEEEFCYIPMGGSLPLKDQRVIGFGGAAAMVHPSTGYQLMRVMMGATDMASAIQSELSKSELNLDRAAAAAYHAVWSPENIRQRNFAVFGGEYLMKQNVEGLRGFFDGFFKLPVELWGGFLAGWPGLPYNVAHESWTARMWFGLSFIVKIPFPVAFDMFTNIVTYSVTGKGTLPQSVTPLLGEPASYEYEEDDATVGDVAAKAEARQMIAESKVVKDLPPAFEEEAEAKELVTN